MRRIAIVLFVAGLAGCASLSHQQMADYQEWESEGRLIKEKSEASAFWMGLLPGGGSFYTRQYAAGILDLLLWPISVLWDPGIGVSGAKKINFEATKYAMERRSMKKTARRPKARPEPKAAAIEEESAEE